MRNTRRLRPSSRWRHADQSTGVPEPASARLTRASQTSVRAAKVSSGRLSSRSTLVIRLRNDADLRAGLKYISVEEHLRPGLPQRDEDDEHQVHGQITATRMYRRPDAPATP